MTDAYCPKCGGTFFVEDDPDIGKQLVCYNCGKRMNLSELERLEREVRIIEENKIIPYPPPKPDCTGLVLTERNHRLHVYYEKHKEMILTDLEKLGQSKMLKLWGIPQSTWMIMRHRWNPEKYPLPDWKVFRSKKEREAMPPVPKKIQVPKPEIKETIKEEPAESTVPFELPAFPNFDTAWPTETQVQWLQSYCEIYKISLKKVTK